MERKTGRRDYRICRKRKSQASDSFKRACFNWGIGRELYSAPFIWVPASRVQMQKKDGRCYCNENFHVASITYNDSREIAGILIASDRSGSIFEWKAQGRDTSKGDSAKKESVKKEAIKRSAAKKESLSKVQMKGLETELHRTGVAMEAVQQRYHVDDPLQMSEETYNKVMRALSKTKSANVA